MIPPHILYSKWAGLDTNYSLEMSFTLLSDYSSQIGLDSFDFSFLFQAEETQRGTRCTQLGSILRRTTSYLILFSFPSLSMKQNHMAVSERNLMEFVKPAISCPIECNLLLVCVLISCGFQKAACPRAPEQLVRALQRADCLHAPACGLPAHFGNRLASSPHASSYPASSCKRIALALGAGGAHLPLPQQLPLGL